MKTKFRHNKKWIDNVFYLLIIFLMFGIGLGYAYPFVLLILLFARIFMSDSRTSGVFICLCGGTLGGIIRSVYPFIPVYGILLIMVGLYLVRRDVLRAVRVSSSGLLFLALTCLVFAIAYLYGPKDAFAENKLVTILVNSLVYFAAFKSFCSNKKFDNCGFAQMLLIASIFYFAASKASASLPDMDGLLDFGWYRKAFYENMDPFGESEGMVDYQFIGNSIVIGITILLSSENFRLRNLAMALIPSSYLVLLSGSRQSLVAFLVILFIFFFISYRKGTLSSILGALCGVVLLAAFVFFIINLRLFFIEDIIGDTVNDDKLGRSLNYLAGIKLFYDRPVVGAGLGGYFQTGIGPHPHNIIIEILCECGIWSFLTVISLLIYYIIHLQISYRDKTVNGSYYFLVFIPIILSSMVSGDLKTNIMLFSIIYAMNTSKRIKKKNYEAV